MESKLSLRRHIRQQLKSWRGADVEEINSAQVNLNERLIEFLKDKAGTWAGFMALPDEPSLQKAIDVSSHLQWVFPLVSGSELSFWRPLYENSFMNGFHNVKEPDPKQSQQIPLEKIDGILVPGVVFDREGGRMGRGKGYYDRALARFGGNKVGVCFALQVYAEVPREPWDVSMDMLITEKESLRFSAQRRS